MEEKIISFRDIVIASRAFTIRALIDLRARLERWEKKGYVEQADHPDGLAFIFTEKGIKEAIEIQSLR